MQELLNDGNFHWTYTIFWVCPDTRHVGFDPFRGNRIHTEKQTFPWILLRGFSYRPIRLLVVFGVGYADKTVSAACPSASDMYFLHYI